MNPEKVSNSEGTNIGYWEQILQAPTPAYQELFNSEKKYILENITEDSKVLDIGCGDGRNMKSILERTENVTGVDNDKKAVEDAKEKFKDKGNVNLVVAEATNLPFESETFDTVTFLMIIPNLNEARSAAIKESVRVLKLGGNMIISSFSENAFEERMKIYEQVHAPIEKIEGTKVIFNKNLGANTSEQFSKEELESFGNEAGLTLIDCQKIGNIAYICKFKKK